MENVVATELRHQCANQEGHADIRVLAQVWQNILQKNSVVGPEPGWNRNSRNRNFLPCGTGTETVACQKVVTGTVIN
jgi:hypothetical protein